MRLTRKSLAAVALAAAASIAGWWVASNREPLNVASNVGDSEDVSARRAPVAVEMTEARVRILNPDVTATDATRPIKNAIAHDAPRMISGRVVDENGRPVARARLAMSSSEHPKPSSGDWKEVSDVTGSHYTDAEGRFAIRAPAASKCCRLFPVATLERHGEEVVVDPPAENVELHVYRSCVISGRVVANTRFADSLAVIATLREKTPDHDESKRIAIISNGRFVIHGLRPGTWDVDVWVLPFQRTVARVEAVNVRLRWATIDGRLDPIDLSWLGWIEVRVVDAENRPLTSAFASRPGRVARFPFEEENLRANEDGCIRVARDAPEIDLVVGAPGCRSEKLKGVANDRRVELHRGFHARVALCSTETAPDGLDFRMQLVASNDAVAEGDLVNRDGYSVALAKWDFEEDAPGRCQLRCRITYEHHTETVETDPAVIEVADIEQQQMFWANTAPGALAAAIQKCRDAARPADGH